MKASQLFLIYFLLVCSVAGQSLRQALIQEIESGQISQTEALFTEAVRRYAPEMLPEAYRSFADTPVKCGFGLDARIRHYWRAFSSQQQDLLSHILFRPDLPLEYVSHSQLFKIHYDTTGYNAVSTEDWNHSGVPDFVEEAAEAADRSYDIEVVRLGFQAPPDDRGVNGPEWDVYIRDMSGYYGMTYTDQQISRNPDVYTSYMELDNDYMQTSTKGIDGLRVTVAHEFFHMIQLGYNGRDDNNDGDFDDLFLMEAGSTWMEDVVYDHINDYLNYLPSFFNSTNRSLDVIDTRREYGLSVLFHFLEKRTGGRSFANTLWEDIVGYPALQALDRSLGRLGYLFEDELVLFYGWNATTGPQADTSLFYPEGDTYPNVRLDGSFLFSKDTTLTGEVAATGARYYRFASDNDLALTLVPVHTAWSGTHDVKEFSLSLIHGTHPAPYTTVTPGVQARLIAENETIWGGVAVLGTNGLAIDLVMLDGSQPGFDPDDLPASYPNPFIPANHAQLTIPFRNETAGVVNLLVTDASGHLVREDRQLLESAGLHTFRWDGRNHNGELVPSGVYVYAVTTRDGIIRRDKLAVVR